MNIITWILLVLNSLVTIISFINIFAKPKAKDRVTYGFQLIISVATIIIFLSYLHII